MTTKQSTFLSCALPLDRISWTFMRISLYDKGMFKKQRQSPDAFWQEYEEKIGEKVLTRGLGKYVSGWDEFDNKKWNNIWGLIITTSGGFRFHHFPQRSWIDALTQFAAEKQPTEKTIFIPNEKIISKKMIKEEKWWKRVLGSTPPHFVVIYTDEEGREKQVLLEAEYAVENL